MTSHKTGRVLTARQSERIRRPLAVVAIYVVLTVAGVFTLAPFAFSMLTAFTSPQRFARDGALALPAPPRGRTSPRCSGASTASGVQSASPSP